MPSTCSSSQLIKVSWARASENERRLTLLFWMLSSVRYLTLLAGVSSFPRRRNRQLRLASSLRRSEVLVPGAGLGRLAWETVRSGYNCQGASLPCGPRRAGRAESFATANEFSLHMLFVSNFILNWCATFSRSSGTKMIETMLQLERGRDAPGAPVHPQLLQLSHEERPVASCAHPRRLSR